MLQLLTSRVYQSEDGALRACLGQISFILLDCFGLREELTTESDIIVVLETVDGLNLSSDIEFFGSLEQVLDGRMFRISTENLLCLLGSAAN